ncbi:glutamate receptor 1-like [Homarus americanus]|uniref:glutamate receptor 1-like n=1 Tax=Homarus americanus TaxID=6706 RepID=UPI001C436B65|nr:glutamate receptor 1-like [Homarus americanus]
MFNNATISCMSGTNLQFFRLPGRMAFITILLTSVLLYNYYTSFLVSALTINKITLPFTDFQSMLKAGTHTFSFNGGGSLENYFRYANNPVWQRVWRDMILTNPKSLTTVDGLAQVLEGSHAFLINEVYFYTKYYHCGFIALPGVHFPVQKSWPMRKNSPLFPLFDHQLRVMAESGILIRARQTWMKTRDTCESTQFQAMELSNMVMAFLILGAGMILATFFLLMECIISKCQWLYKPYSHNIPRRFKAIKDKHQIHTSSA